MIYEKTGICVCMQKPVFCVRRKIVKFFGNGVDKECIWCYLKYMDVSTPQVRVLIAKNEALVSERRRSGK